MKRAFAYLLGMSTASAYWAAAMWGHDSRGDSLWVFPSVLTVFSLVCAMVILTKPKTHD